MVLSGQTALNIVWTLVTGFLVMFMQAGFALVETGLTRAKNVAHTMGMNFLVYSIGIIGFWALGFGLQMGGVGALSTFGNDATLSSEMVIHIAGREFGLFGMRGFFLSPAVYTAPVAALFLFQMVFMDTTATIPTGAMAERWKFTSFVIFSFVISTIIYPIYANWVWGGGWLSQLGHNFGLGHGHVDFAGSSVVHMVGGVAALVGAKMMGPRIGKYSTDGKAQPIPGHNIPMAVLGTFILAFGWFGFNPGSTLSGTDTHIAVIAVNTMLASATGAFGAYLYMKFRFDTPDVSMMCNGMLAGLVAITAPCAFVTAPAAMFIGLVAGHAGGGLGAVHRERAEDRRPGRRVVGARRLRRLGHPVAGPVRRRPLRRRLERRAGAGPRPVLRRPVAVRRRVHRHRGQRRVGGADDVRDAEAGGRGGRQPRLAQHGDPGAGRAGDGDGRVQRRVASPVNEMERVIVQNRNINNNDDRRAEAPPASRGFSAQLRGASLWDLVQIECLSRSRRSMQVVGEGGVGYLYFDRGRVVHATTAQAVGEAAALEILAWTNGSFQASDRPWPEQPSIQTALEGLLLRAAQLRDEAARVQPGGVPGRGPAGRPTTTPMKSWR